MWYDKRQKRTENEKIEDKRKSEIEKRGETMREIWRTGMMMLVSVMLLMVTACDNAPIDEEPEKQELRLWYYWDEFEARRCLLEMVSEFNEMHSTMEIVPKYVPDEDFKKTLALAIADDEMPDLAIVDSSDVQYYDSMGGLTDVSPFLNESVYLEYALTSCRRADGSYVGLPLGMNCLVFYYNVDILKNAGVEPPKTLDEFVEVAKQVSSDEVYGCAFPSLQSEESTFCFLPILWSKGGSIGDIVSKESQEAFDFLRQLVNSGAMSKSSVNMTLTDITREFAKGNLAMMVSISGKERMVRLSNPELNFQIADIPNGEDSISVMDGEVLVVTSKEQIPESLQFVEFMANTEQIKNYINAGGYLAPRNDILEWQMQENPEMRKYIEYMRNSRLRDLSPYWPSVSLAIADAINEIILQSEQPDILEELHDKIDKIQRERDERE